ncbi:alpha/beta fold hydrolase [Stenotrophomonas sp. PS02289]|uniref:alpha/beta hydrolase family protein n=1 Tax=Stenotrophomonas sp. PS02289 TaxID=2991422 RepID=UPI00249B65F5|nr:alpha/beta fold hydrolase [Stenotrophomonas sp. PS02289]
MIAAFIAVVGCLVAPVAVAESSRAEPGSTDRGRSEIRAVGEVHGVAHTASAAIRDLERSDQVRYTVWYPAQTGAKEEPITLGPPGSPLFVVGSAAAQAPVAAGRWPVLLLSHGNGGTARMMGWFGTAMARAGYVVVAVDHPGNNGIDAMTASGSILMWNRVDDLAAAWAAVQADPKLSAHLDAKRLGLAGYSAGGFTALVAAGVKPDMARLAAFCEANPKDGVCAPQLENPEFTFERRMALAAAPQMAPWVAKSGEDRRIPNVRAVFLMAPAIVQAFDPADLAELDVPLSVVVGEADTVASPATNSKVISEANATVKLQVLPAVGHYDFLSDCTDLGRERVGPLCEAKVDRSTTHQTAIDQATSLFAAGL